MPRPDTHPHSSPQVTQRSMSFTWMSATWTILATAVNLGLYGLGRATDASLLVDPGAGEAGHLVVPFDVAWKTVLPLALGAIVFALLARRSHRWVSVAIVGGTGGVTATIPFVFTGAHDITTAVVLASMHTVVGLAYLVIGLRARQNAER